MFDTVILGEVTLAHSGGARGFVRWPASFARNIPARCITSSTAVITAATCSKPWAQPKRSGQLGRPRARRPQALPFSLFRVAASISPKGKGKA